MTLPRRSADAARSRASGVDEASVQSAIDLICEIAEQRDSELTMPDARQSQSDLIKTLLHLQAAAILEMTEAIDDAQLSGVVETLVACRGNVILTGIGKSGIIARKVAATMCSTGTPAVFLHAGEALHGELGLVRERDVLIAFSRSGETPEVIRTARHLRRRGVHVLGVVGNPESRLAQTVDRIFSLRLPSPTRPSELVPTSSTTAMVALGDALALAVMNARGLGKSQYLANHPARPDDRGGSSASQTPSVGKELSAASIPVPAVAVIPARLGSSRLPRKVLAPIQGKPLIAWVHDAVKATGLFDEVVVATDSPEVAETVRTCGVNTEITRADHASGSSRVAEVARRRGYQQVVVNVQADYPFVTTSSLLNLLRPFAADTAVAMTTIAAPLTEPRLLGDPNIVKVVCDRRSRALYFSRAPIGGHSSPALHHIGIYAFAPEFLQVYATLEPSELERSEDLEQLRVLDHGYAIHVESVCEPLLAVNTSVDLDAARAHVESEEGQH